MTFAPDISDDTPPFSAVASDGQCNDREAEEQLVFSLRNREDSGFETLVRSYGPLVLSIARRYLRCDADAADCFQETFVAVYRDIEKFQNKSSLRQWVRGVAVNKCLMAMRQRKRLREDAIETMLPEFDNRGKRLQTAGPHDIGAIGDSLDDEHRRQIVRRGIDSLPTDYRLVLLLRDIDGYSTRETADILDIQINAVKTRLHRARSALKHILETEFGRSGYDADL